MKRLIIIVLSFAWVIIAGAQNQRDLLKEFEEFRKQSAKDYYDFRDKANADYVEFMRQAWKEFGAEPPIPAPNSPDPPEPSIAKSGEELSSDSVPFAKVIPFVQLVTQPQPVAPISVVPVPVLPSEGTPPPDVSLFPFSFYNTDCRIRLENKQKISLKDISEETVADTWEVLSGDSYNATIADCLHLREQLKLCDWGYYLLVKTIADKYYGADHPNESVLFQVFILTQSGYKIRIARTEDRLIALMPFDHTIYTYSYLMIDGSKLFVMDKGQKSTRFFVCNYSFPKEQGFSVQINSLPQLDTTSTTSRELVSARYPIKVEIKSNQNLIDFFNSCPLSSEWNLYARASLSEQAKEQLYPVLKEAINGKSMPEAADMLLNFVQTAFVYQIDEDQFGYERPLFGDETLYYSGSNCKDRAILFSILVDELLNLDVVFLNYPGHLATAVCFDENVEGNYLMVDGRKYIVCDPTYVGATIGQEMPVVKNTKPKVMKIWK